MASRLSSLLADFDCQALLVVAKTADDPALAPFVRRGRVRRALLVAPREGRPRLGYDTPMEREEAASTGLDLLTPQQLDLGRWMREGGPPHRVLANVLSRALHLSGVSPGQVALAGSADAGQIVAAAREVERDGWTLVPGETIVARLRKRKTSSDVKEIECVARGIEEAMRRVADLLAGAASTDDGSLLLEGERLRVGRLKHEVARIFAERGLDQPEGNIIAPAEEGAVPHSTGTEDRILRVGESLVVDLFPRGRLFADATRTFCVGPPSEALAQGHRLVVEALERARERARVGATGREVHLSVCRFFETEGVPTAESDPGTERGYVHGLGHGVGAELHELPTFRETSEEEGRLAVDDVFTLEPGIYEPSNGWGVRLEDTIHLTEDGPRSLTPWPMDLDPRAWARD